MVPKYKTPEAQAIFDAIYDHMECGCMRMMYSGDSEVGIDFRLTDAHHITSMVLRAMQPQPTGGFSV